MDAGWPRRNDQTPTVGSAKCERLGRLLRLLHLIMGNGRWDAGTLAEELECSRRTVYRLLQTLSLAGVPWYFDESVRAYRVRPGYRFPEIEQSKLSSECNAPVRESAQADFEQVIRDGEALARSLQNLLESLRKFRD